MARTLTLAAALAAGALSLGAAPASSPELHFQLVEGQNLNAFVRDGTVAAHLLLRSGIDPRILVAFPAGNSGVGLWFAPVGRPATWALDRAPKPVNSADGTLHGITAVAHIDVARLTPKQAVLSNVRYLRDYQAVGRFPGEVAADAQIGPDSIRYSRPRIDGAPGYALTLRVIEGRIERGSIMAGAAGRIRIEITALTGDTPLTPLPLGQLLNPRAAPDPEARKALAFLSYREKFLAGSWRFNTYFGRDTLMSVRLLMPVLQPAAIEAGLGSVLARLSPGGEVAHEEGIGEFAVIQNRKAGRPGDGAELDYGMIDDDYMLAPIVADYLEGPARDRGAEFLATMIDSAARPGDRAAIGTLLVRNVRFVLQRARDFAAAPSTATLIAIKPGRMSGEWRDSDEGLGRGIYPYDVNAALVPAALAAADRLYRSGRLDRYLTPADRAALDGAAAMATTWRDQAPPLFRVTIGPAKAVSAIRGYARTLGVSPAAALAALGRAPLRFHALSIDAAGEAVPIINSDEGFALLFGNPAPADLDRDIAALMRPFPAGLMTDAGLLVANAAFAGAEAQARFTPGAYHGAVIWSWQQALLAAGLERQLKRHDLPAPVRTRLAGAQAALWRVIRATRGLQSSELWSWRYRDGQYQPVAFGAGKADVDESNAAQLWSTVYLAVQAPKRHR
ncbi:hypothetical protein [Sphingomonas sp. 28-63-12]|uniref:hypothetical protein n=1 Tax=Sphingomonas sp. 28-63-12 TaxID=1970434 RepID=UPI000BD730DD|nr:MAG: hypothetical protein B7Y47_06310 [Sphingomonas sp. 28-63-12]